MGHLVQRAAKAIRAPLGRRVIAEQRVKREPTEPQANYEAHQVCKAQRVIPETVETRETSESLERQASGGMMEW
jgi:hypothetical protein